MHITFKATNCYDPILKIQKDSSDFHAKLKPSLTSIPETSWAVNHWVLDSIGNETIISIQLPPIPPSLMNSLRTKSQEMPEFVKDLQLDDPELPKFIKDIILEYA